jgi:hypothetical protein
MVELRLLGALSCLAPGSFVVVEVDTGRGLDPDPYAQASGRSEAGTASWCPGLPACDRVADRRGRTATQRVGAATGGARQLVAVRRRRAVRASAAVRATKAVPAGPGPTGGALGASRPGRTAGSLIEFDQATLLAA